MNEKTAGINEWRAGGVFLAATMIIYTCTTNPIVVIGPLIKILQAEFGWSRAAITTPYLFLAIGTVVFGPIAGSLVDRVGPRRVALFGLWAVAGAILMMGLAGPSIWGWYIAWAVFGMICTFAGTVIWVNGVISRFEKNKGVALSIMLSMNAVATGLLPMFAVAVSDAFGWRMVYFLLAAFVAFICWPLTLIFFRSARELGELDPAKGSSKPLPSPKGGVKQALRGRHLWQIGFGYILAAAAISTLMVHLQPILSDAGMSAMEAAEVVIILGPATLVGRFLVGFLLDHAPTRYVAAAALGLPAICYLILIFGGISYMGGVVSAALLGVASAAEIGVLAILVNSYFPPQNFAGVYGVMLGFFASGSALGPIITGAVYDRIHSYAPTFVVLAIAPALGAILMLLLGKQRNEAQTAAA